MQVLVLAAVLVVLSGVTCYAQEGKDDKDQKGLKVTILLYSGRPNPTYMLEDKDVIEKLKTLVGRAPAHEKYEKDTVIPSILGYNGVVVENKGMTVKELPAFLNIYKGNIEAQDVRKKFLRDEGNEIEDLLINKALEKKVIDEKTLRIMKAN